jgi:hypothetical protein
VFNTKLSALRSAQSMREELASEGADKAEQASRNRRGKGRRERHRALIVHALLAFFAVELR